MTSMKKYLNLISNPKQYSSAMHVVGLYQLIIFAAHIKHYSKEQMNLCMIIKDLKKVVDIHQI